MISSSVYFSKTNKNIMFSSIYGDFWLLKFKMASPVIFIKQNCRSSVLGCSNIISYKLEERMHLEDCKNVQAI